MKRLLLFCGVAFLVSKSNAQLFGTLSVPGTHTSLASAIADINQQGTFGAVTVNIAAGYTETVVAGGYSLYTTGTPTSPIIFQKSGSGANPVLFAYTGTRTPGTLSQDGFWRLIGCDYITIDGIDLVDQNVSNPATMEFGIGLFKTNGIDGCQNNVIRNCNISLQSINNATGSGPAADGSRGIDVVNATTGAHTTPLTIYSQLGANSNNQFYNNRIQNCNIGISLSGFADASPYAFADTGNDIGGPTATTGNTIVNFGGGGSVSAASAIRTLAQYSLNISYNTINNNNGSGINHPTTLRGIHMLNASGADASVVGNTITLHGGGTTSQLNVIETAAGSGGAANLVNISNNVITGGTYATAVSGSFYGIWNTGAPASLNISNNVFAGNSTAAGSGATYLIYNTGAVASASISNNQLGFLYLGNSAYTGVLYGIYNTGSVLSGSLDISGNVFTNFTHVGFTGTGTIYFIYNNGDYGTFQMTGNTWNGLNMNHSAAEYFMYNSSSTQNVLSVSGNTISNHTRLAAAGSLYGYYATSTSPGTCVQTFSNNLISNITASVQGTGSFYGIYATEGNTSPYPRKTVAGNRILNVNMNGTGTFYGIYVTDLGDAGTAAGSSIYNNEISSCSFSDLIYGLYTSSPVSPTYAAQVYGNTVRGLVSNGASATVYGSYIGSNNAGIAFYRNRIADITANGSTGTAHGLYGTTSTSSSIYNNLIGNINAPFTTGVNKVNGIYISGGTNISILYNTIYLSGTSAGANFGSNGIYASTTPVLTLRNNIIVNNLVPTGTGIAAAFRRSSTSLTSYSVASNNNLFYAGTPAASNVIFHNGTTGYQTLAQFQTLVAPREALSVSQNPAFLSLSPVSPNYLHILPNQSTPLESGAVNIAGITNDHDLEIRQGNPGYQGNGSAPDIGADEFDLNTTPCAGASAGVISPASATLCAGLTASFVSVGYTPGTGLTHQWKVSNTPGGPYSNVIGGVGATGTEYSSAALTAGVYYFVLETTCASASVTGVSNEATVTVNAIPGATATAASTLICEGQNIVLGGSTDIGVTFSWSGPAGFSSSVQNPTVNAAAAYAGGVYVFYAEQNGCASPGATVQVDVSTISFALSVSDPGLCLGETATVTVNGAVVSYTWNTGATSSTIAVSPQFTSTYSVVATNTAGCQALRSVTIAVTNPTISATGSVACGPQITSILSVNAFSPSTVSWFASPGSTVPISSGTSYTLQSVSTTTTLYAEATSASTGSLFTNVAGTSAFLGEMFDVVALNSIVVTGFDVHFAAGTGTVEVWYRPGTHVGFSTSNAGWTMAASVTLTSNGPGQLTTIPATLSVPIAAGQTYAFYIVANTGPNVRYSGGTLLGNPFAQNNDLQILEGTTGNNYFNAGTSPRSFNGTVKYEVPGCTSPRIPVTLTLSPIPVVTAVSSPSLVCPGNTSTLSASGASSYTWSGLQSGSSLTVNPSVSTVYTVTGANALGCAATNTVEVGMHPLPSVVVSQSVAEVCPSSPTTFTASGAISYTWSTGAIGPILTVTPAVSSNYSITGTSPEGCTSSTVVSVATKSVPVINISQSTMSLCAGEEVVFTASGANTYTWLPGNVTGSSFTVNPVVPAVYNAIGQDINGCKGTGIASIAVDACTGLEEALLRSSVSVYPNPSSGLFNLLLPEGQKTVRVYNTNGKLVLDQELLESEYRIDLSGMARGIYFMRIGHNGAEISFKLIRD